MKKDEEKKIKYKFPKTPGACLARLAKLQDMQDAITIKLAPIAKEEAALREHMIEAFKKDELNGVRGSGRSLSITNVAVPVLKDWKKFFKFAMRKGNDDLLPHSVSSTAWRERMEAGKAVPGVDTFNRIGLRVNRIKEK
jgi:hypothetical protein